MCVKMRFIFIQIRPMIFKIKTSSQLYNIIKITSYPENTNSKTNWLVFALYSLCHSQQQEKIRIKLSDRDSYVSTI